jgi:iron complex outermembrane receptor protein
VILYGINVCAETEIETLLNDISVKTDLSEKTKLENGGISYIYTRDDLERMQAYVLKDILKSTYPFGYNENNYGLTDPYNMRSLPSNSSKVKIFIDDQELTTGLFGSCISIYGNMKIGFVDHIEVYFGNPTFESTTEPAYVIIKLYSKVAQKDGGSKLLLSGGSYGTKNAAYYHAAELDNEWSYFSYISLDDNKRKKYHNDAATLSKDTQTLHLFGSFYTNEHKFLIDGIVQKKESFIAQSMGATPDDSTIDNTYLHIGYNGKMNRFSFLLTFDRDTIESNFSDLYREKIKAINQFLPVGLPYMMQTELSSEVYTAGINYNLQSQKNTLVSGVKYRYKQFHYDKIIYNDKDAVPTDYNAQTTLTLFAEDQYNLAENMVLTAGISYAKVRNHHTAQNDELLAYRLGYTYTDEHWVSKTIISYMETMLEPYLINHLYLKDPNQKLPKTEQQIFLQNVKYTDESDTYEFIASYLVEKNQLMSNPVTGLLDTYGKDVSYTSFLGRYTKAYNRHDKIEVALSVDHMNHLPVIGKLNRMFGYIRGLNTFGAFDLFNEFVYYRYDTPSVKSYVDFSTGITYHSTDDLSFSLKGTNLFSDAKKSHYMRFNYDTMTFDTPLYISPVDKAVRFTMEYTF